MKCIEFQEFQRSPLSYLNAVFGEASLLRVTEVDGRDVVIMPARDYESLAETLHLLSTEANARHSANSIRSARVDR